MSQSRFDLSWIFRGVASITLLIVSLVLFSTAFARPLDLGRVGNQPGAVPQKVESPRRAAEAAASKPAESPIVSKGARIVASFTVFLLAVFVGVEVINKVPPTLHTPLMSGSNAISGITVIGALLAAGHVGGGFGATLGMIAIVFAMINVVGGFLVTHRMLMMFKKR